MLPVVVATMNKEKLEKMAAQVRTGGKGSVRRKKKAIHKTTTTDDKRLQNTLKRLGVNNIPAIEEVNLFKDNGTVIHFNNPKGKLHHRCPVDGQTRRVGSTRETVSEGREGGRN